MPATRLSLVLTDIENFLSYQSPGLTTSSVAPQLTDGCDSSTDERQVEKVPALFRNKQTHRDAYDPVIVSIGPYYHGIKGYQHAETFKEKSCTFFLMDCREGKPFFINKIKANIEKIRNNYEKLEGELEDDEKLASLIFSDACFFIHYVKNHFVEGTLEENKSNEFYKYFGPARLKFIFRDLLLVENQIPFWIIELLMESADGKLFTWDNVLRLFMSSVIPGLVHGSGTEIKKPLHFLGAYYNALKVQIPVQLEAPEKSIKYRFRSITNLKAKGIHFKPSNSNAVKFYSYKLYGELHIPPLEFSTEFFVLYSNIIAYEMSASSNSEFNVSSWVNFMKSLIDSPSDVKILREKGILLNDMVGDDEVVKVIKDLDTFGLENISGFSKVRDDIQKHCRSKAKTLLAELYHAHFESPWNTIALLAAVLLIVLTFTQTVFTVNPAS